MCSSTAWTGTLTKQIFNFGSRQDGVMTLPEPQAKTPEGDSPAVRRTDRVHGSGLGTGRRRKYWEGDDPRTS